MVEVYKSLSDVTWKAPRILGSTKSLELRIPLGFKVEIYFGTVKGGRLKLPSVWKGGVPQRPVSRIWMINEGKTDAYFDIGSFMEGPNDMHLTSMLRGGGETDGVSEGREFKTPENTMTMLFIQPQATELNPNPIPANAFVRVETTT